MLTPDTSKDALGVQFDRLRRARTTRRVEMAVELETLARELALAGIRASRPGATAEQVEHEYRNLVFGLELAEKVRAEKQPRRETPKPDGAARENDLVVRMEDLLERIRAEAQRA